MGTKSNVQHKRRGEVALTTSDGDSVVLKFGTNAICGIEEELDKTLGEILDEMSDKDAEGKPKKSRLSMRTIRTMVQHAVKGRSMSPEEVGELIDDVGFKTITEAFGAVFEGQSQGSGKAGTESPPPSGELSGEGAA